MNENMNDHDDNLNEDWMSPLKVQRYAEMEEEWERPYSILKKKTMKVKLLLYSFKIKILT
jgi:hypothetical protein